jgi:hypothetical protein
MYEEKLKPGPYPTSESHTETLSGTDTGTLSLYLADVAGIASHGEKLIGLEAIRREQFRKITPATMP